MAVLKTLQSIMKVMGETKGFDRVLRSVQVVSASSGRCVCEMTVDESHVNRIGGLHGGLTATLVDNISTLAIMSADSHPGVSVDLNVSYLQGAKAGDVLEIKSECLKQGKTLAFTNTNILNKKTGALLATGRQTKYIDMTGKLSP